MSTPNDALTEGDLVSLFPSSVRTSIAAMETARADWQVVGLLLAGAPTAGVALKGATGFTNRLWESVKGEFRAFLCTDASSYSDLRSNWAEYEKKGAKFAASALSAAIGANIGMAAAIVAPVVIWLLLVLARIGKNALCQALSGQPAAAAQPNPQRAPTT